MTKKEYILKLLTALDGTWPLAAGLKILVEASVLDEQTMEALFVIFQDAVDGVLDDEEREKLQQGLTFLQKLKATELESQKHDEKDIQELDALLEGI